MGGSPSITVIGAGIIGASIAWHLTRAGARVTLFAAGQPGGVATPNSFSWINSNYSFARPYFELRHRSMTEWRRIGEELPQLPVTFCGSVYLPAKGVDLEQFVKRGSSWGYRIELIDGARVRELEPHLLLETDVAAHAPDEGAVEAEEVVSLLVAAAVENGMDLRADTPVQGLAVSDGCVAGVRVGGDVIYSDEVVVAAGVATPEFLEETGYHLPLVAPPGLLAHSTPVRHVLNGLILAEGLHLRQKPDGALLAGADFKGAELEGDAEGGGRELLRRAMGALDLDQDLSLERTTTGYRPTPEDGLPVVGRVPGVAGLYVAVMHSGVTLMPAVGRFATAELLAGNRDLLLAPFGPERFAESTGTRAQAG